MRIPALLGLAVSCAALSHPAAAQFAKSEDAVRYRQSAMFIQSQHLGRLAAMANGRVPFDAAAAVANAEVITQIAKLPWGGFGPGTEGGKARPDIWKESARFKELGDRLIGDSDKLVAAAKAGNLDTLKAAVGATADTCKACHDAFRSR